MRRGVHGVDVGGSAVQGGVVVLAAHSLRAEWNGGEW